jgi:hypothetical protein
MFNFLLGLLFISVIFIRLELFFLFCLSIFPFCFLLSDRFVENGYIKPKYIRLVLKDPSAKSKVQISEPDFDLLRSAVECSNLHQNTKNWPEDILSRARASSTPAPSINNSTYRVFALCRTFLLYCIVYFRFFFLAC